jgi:hypothetical protein
MAASSGLDTSSDSAAQIVREGIALVESLEERDVKARILGGVAVVIHCESLEGRPHRPIADIDLVVRYQDRNRLSELLSERGYEAATRFNAINGDKRMMFAREPAKLDVFVDELSMCHRLDLRKRLDLESPTLSPTDLFLTKLQIVELTEKDAADIDVLLSDHAVGHGEGNHLNVDYMCELVADDWGLWRTITGTLQRIGEFQPQHGEKVAGIANELEATEKSRRFRMRARVGERKRWYDLPEDVLG